MDCDQVFMILTRGPFPTGEAWDEEVETHLETCGGCWRLAEALLASGELDSGCEQAANVLASGETAPALEVLGTCRMLRRDRPEAIRLLRRAAELAPMDVRLAGRLKKVVGEP